ncbi:hypothetical protein C8R45DRAFT_477843 [Mycena sanguinolenta]|nr:hypothetical protein C8R45DRAFT_477843 [Mycena sanguinolenta]
MYLAAFFTIARLYRVIVLTLRPPSSFSSTSGGAASLVRRRPCHRRSPGPAPRVPDPHPADGARASASHIPLPPLSMVAGRAIATRSSAVIYILGAAMVLLPVFPADGDRAIPPHIPLPPLSMVPRRAVATVNSHEKTVMDGKKTIVIDHLRRGRCLWRWSGSSARKRARLEGISWRNVLEAEAGVAPCPLGEYEGGREGKPQKHGVRGTGAEGEGATNNATAHRDGHDVQPAAGSASKTERTRNWGSSGTCSTWRSSSPCSALGHRRRCARRLARGYRVRLPRRHALDPVRGTTAPQRASRWAWVRWRSFVLPV